MKSKILTILAGILALIVLFSGGIFKAKYDSTVAERDAALVKLSKAQSDLKTSQQLIKILQASGTNTAVQTTPTDVTEVSWNPILFINKEYQFKLHYPSTWRITNQNRLPTLPVEIQYDGKTTVPGSWVSIIKNSSANQWTDMPIDEVVTKIFLDAEVVTAGTTVLVDNSTAAAYCEFYATVDTYPMHCYVVGYIDNNRWILFVVWTVESTVPWEGETMRQIAHTLNKAAPAEVASTGIFTNTKYNFSIKYDPIWVSFDAATVKHPDIVCHFASARYICPGLRVSVLPASKAATLTALLPTITWDPNTVVTGTGTSSLADGTEVTAATMKYIAPDGETLDAIAYGFIKNDSWFVLFIYNHPNLGTVDSLKPNTILQEWVFN